MEHRGPYLVVKEGRPSAELEDAAAVSLSSRYFRTALAAIADGATESGLSGYWARALVAQFCFRDSPVADPPRGVLEAIRVRVCGKRPLEERDEFVARALTAYADERAAYLTQRNQSGRPLQWFEEAKLAAGSHAAFLGVEISSRRLAVGGIWNAWGRGDVCLFQVRDNRLRVAWPLDDSSGFDDRPPLLCTKDSRLTLQSSLAHHRGNWRRGDCLIIASDALAAWFLAQHEKGRRPWESLESLTSQAAFEGFVGSLRTDGEVQNDDMAALLLVM